MYFDFIYIVKHFVEDVAANCPEAEFFGDIRHFFEGQEDMTIKFVMTKGKLNFDENDHALDEYNNGENKEPTDEQKRKELFDGLKEYSDEDILTFINCLMEDEVDEDLKITKKAYAALDIRAQCVELLLADFSITEDSQGINFEDYTWNLSDLLESFLSDDDEDCDGEDCEDDDYEDEEIADDE